MTITFDDPAELWEAAKGQLQLDVSRPNYETWLKRTTGISYDDGQFVVGAPDAFVAETLEQRMSSLIARTLKGIVKSPVEVRFCVASAADDTDARDEAPIALAEPSPVTERVNAVVGSHSTLNPKYTFDRFVIGKSNELAHAAAMAVAQRPGELYNPLVMYSDVGLGKTHLMQAIGHQVASRGLSLIYATTEEFTNSFIKAVREGATEGFRDHYRTAEVLLLDDVQFLIGKEQTQEGFFHTFNALHMSNRQVVITSDRPVSALTLLEDRIRSRLAGGLVVDIQTPDIETRIAILREKAEGATRQVSDEVVDFLAQRVQRNVRELEGSLNKVLALADLTGSSVTIDLVKQAIADVLQTARDRKIPDSVVVDAVASYFAIQVEALRGRKRDQRTARARQVAMYLLREELQLGPTAIGRILGGKDHTTVMYGCDRIANLLSVDPRLRRDILRIRESLAA